MFSNVNLLEAASQMAHPRMLRNGAKTHTPPAQDSAADPEVMKKINEIIKDKSADCIPRKVIP